MTTRQPRYGDIFAGHDEGAEMAELARVLWAELKSDLESRNLFDATRGRMVDRLVRLRVEYEQHYPIAAQEGPVCLSGDGNQYVNMLWSQCQKMNDQILKLEDALLISPRALSAKSDKPHESKKPPAAAAEFLARPN